MTCIDRDLKIVENVKINKIYKKFGMNSIELKSAFAGDIVSIAGCSGSTVGTTLNSQGVISSIPSIPIDPPMISMELSINDSPLKGTEG